MRLAIAQRHWILLAALVVFVSLFNITKAIHIDDTVYLLIAKNIVADPTHPYAGMLNWDHTAKPMSRVNHPALVFYFYALVIWIFGFSELALHLAYIFFTTGAIVAFYALAQGQVTPPRALFFTGLLALGPAFIPAQNLMLDIPTLLLWELFFLFLFSRRYLGSALSLGLGCLVRYTTVALGPIFITALLLGRSRRAILAGLIPVLLLAAWALLTRNDFGQMHSLTTLQKINFDKLRVLDHSYAWLLCLGGAIPFSFLYLVRLKSRPTLLLFVLGLTALLTWYYPSPYLDPSPEVVKIVPYYKLFFANGAFALIAVISLLILDRSYYLLAWLILGAGFNIAFAPFMAVRHILLIFPVLILALGKERQPLLDYLGLALTLFLGVAFGISDWRYADTYRQQAATFADEYQGKRIWVRGHWGWQWYTTEAGFMTFDRDRTQFSDGDLLITPESVSQQQLLPEQAAALRLIREVVVPGTWDTAFRSKAVNPSGGLYASEVTTPPWRISFAPLERFFIHQFDAGLYHPPDNPPTPP